MIEPKVIFAFIVMVLGSFMVRPVFAQDLSPSTRAMMANCKVRAIGDSHVESEKSFPVKIESLQAQSEVQPARGTLIGMREQGLFGIETGRENLLDLKVYADSVTGKRIYRATLYNSESGGLSLRGPTLKSLSSSEFVSGEANVQVRHLDYSMRKMFDCSLSEVSAGLLISAGVPDGR